VETCASVRGNEGVDARGCEMCERSAWGARDGGRGDFEETGGIGEIYGIENEDEREEMAEMRSEGVRGVARRGGRDTEDRVCEILRGFVRSRGSGLWCAGGSRDARDICGEYAEAAGWMVWMGVDCGLGM
jgi:hypothetical protein